MFRVKSSVISLVLVTSLSTQLFSCGYILHPDQRGQKSGDLDLAIVGLDAIGLLFFIIPGLIAFSVDIYSGTIYLPNGTSKHSFNEGGIRKIHIDPKNITKETIIAAIKQNTGIVINFNDPRLESFRDKNLEMQLVSQ